MGWYRNYTIIFNLHDFHTVDIDKFCEKTTNSKCILDKLYEYGKFLPGSTNKLVSYIEKWNCQEINSIDTEGFVLDGLYIHKNSIEIKNNILTILTSVKYGETNANVSILIPVFLFYINEKNVSSIKYSGGYHEKASDGNWHEIFIEKNLEKELTEIRETAYTWIDDQPLKTWYNYKL